MSNPFANESTAIRTGPIESIRRADLLAAIELKNKRDLIRLGNPNLSDEEIDNIIYIREHPILSAQVSTSKSQIRTNKDQSKLNRQHEESAKETQIRNNGLRFFGYSTLSDRQAELNPELVSLLEKQAATDATIKGVSAAAFIPGMQWLKGISAPLYYGANAALTGVSAYDWYKNGPNFWNVTGTLGGGYEAFPIIVKGVLTGKKAYDTYRLSNTIAGAPFSPEYETWLGNSSLQNIGTAQEYLDYLTTIFPKSKYSKIAYHGGPKGITRFNTPKKGLLNAGINSGTKDYGIYFAKDKKLAEYYANTLKKGNQQLYRVKLNLENPMRYDNPSFTQRFIGGDDLRFNTDAITDYWYTRLGLNNYNGIILDKSGSPFSRGLITMFNPDDIHILGSSDDVTKFRNWKLNPIILTPSENYNIPNTPALYNVTFKNIAKLVGGLTPIILPVAGVTVPAGIHLYNHFIKAK